jgi:putative acyl-CoA dehydrogenase
MANVLADLCVESEAATLLAVRQARAIDESAPRSAESAALQRNAPPVAQYRVCKRATPVAAEALEVLGGNGFVEESPMPRLLRDSPLNSIWEGSGNVIALDVLRAMAKEPAGIEALFDELGLATGLDERFDAAVDAARGEAIGLRAVPPLEAERRARSVVERLALALQGSLVLRYSPPAVAEGFLASRLGGDAGRTFGTLPPGIDLDAIVERHRPRLVDV